MKTTFYLFVFFISSFFVFPSYAQIATTRNINVSLATNFNRHYLKFRDSNLGIGFNQIKTPPGYSIELGIDSLRIDWLRIDVSLNFDQYRSKFTASYSALPGGSYTEVDLTKSVLGLTVYPIRIIGKNFRCQFGFEYARLLTEHFSGFESTYLMGQNSTHTELNDKYERYSTLSNTGIRIKAGYTFRMNNHISISPYYSLFYSLSNEYPAAPGFIKSFRNSIGLSCFMPLK